MIWHIKIPIQPKTSFYLLHLFHLNDLRKKKKKYKTNTDAPALQLCSLPHAILAHHSFTQAFNMGERQLEEIWTKDTPIKNIQGGRLILSASGSGYVVH